VNGRTTWHEKQWLKNGNQKRNLVSVIIIAAGYVVDQGLISENSACVESAFALWRARAIFQESSNQVGRKLSKTAFSSPHTGVKRVRNDIGEEYKEWL